MREKENLTLLGNQQTEYSMDYNPSVLEAFQNKHPETAGLCNDHDFVCSG